MGADGYEPSWEAADEALDEYIDRLRPGDVAFAEIDPTSRRWTGSIVVVSRDESGPTVAIDDGVDVPEKVVISRGTTTVVVDNSGSRPSYEITLRTKSPNLLNRLHLRSLVEQALGRVTITTRDQLRWPGLEIDGEVVMPARPDRGALPAGSIFPNESAARRFVRAEVTERDVHRAAEAYNDGGLDEVMRVMFVEERQAWRYVSRAQDAGLAPRKRNRRKKGS